MSIPLNSGAFAGMSQAQLLALRVTAQTALIDLISGGKPVTVSYGNGEGQRMVTYTRTNEASLRNLIRELNAALGGRQRRGVGVRFA